MYVIETNDALKTSDLFWGFCIVHAESFVAYRLRPLGAIFSIQNQPTSPNEYLKSPPFSVRIRKFNNSVKRWLYPLSSAVDFTN